MASAYNWARMCTKGEEFPDNQFMSDEAVVRLKNLYKSIWTATLGSDNGFDTFFKECLDASKSIETGIDVKIGGEPVDGDIFKKKLNSEFERIRGKKLDSKEFAAQVAAYSSGDKEIDNAMRMISAQYSTKIKSNRKVRFFAL